MKRHSFRLAAAALGLLLVLPTGLPASAASSFDAGYYATLYPDVAAACGTDEGALLQHYIQFGASEGRKPSAWGRAGDTDLKLTDAQIAAIWSPVPIKELANYKSLKRKMTDDEFAQAYEQARRIVTPLAFKSREEQLAGIANALREMVDDGTVAYSTDVPHYNDAYGYLVLHVASCAGCARTTGLCLNMLGISPMSTSTKTSGAISGAACPCPTAATGSATPTACTAARNLPPISTRICKYVLKTARTNRNGSSPPFFFFRDRSR